MGKPYDPELDQLPETYRWAASTPIGPLVASLRAVSSLPLIAVGSGGSFTTADFAAQLHRERTGALASAQTPMEAAAASLDFRSMAVLLATAGGKNPDVLGAFRRLVVREPRRFLVLCLSVRSPLARLAAKHRFVECLELDLPSGKDGFLATNSLLASVVLLTRAYAEAFGAPDGLPADLLDLLGPDAAGDRTLPFDQECQPLWQRDTLVVLYSPTTRSAAMDLESKFTEAALGNVRAADYRNFAHGRHHWLAKRPGESAVLAFITDEDEDLASRTLAHVPAAVPVLRLKIPFRGATAGVAALARALFVVGSAGRARRIDPGRPGVPGFGRKIYHLRAFNDGRGPDSAMPPEEVAAVERKSRKSVAMLANQGRLDFWREAYAAFIRGFDKASFRGVVFDYDGTLCDEADRYKGLSPVVGRELTRLLRAGTLLGIATGRGKSVREALRERIPKKHWDRVVVGYYNGGDIGMLHDDARPNGTEQVADALKPVLTELQGHALLSRLTKKLEFRLPQIQVVPATGSVAESVWRLLQQLVYGLAIPGVLAVRSSHSMDVLAPGVSKRSLLERVAELLGNEQPSPLLCIGDRGQWPGNDFSLLDGPFALSVDEASEDPATCWNLAPAGMRCVQACLHYLRQIKGNAGRLRFMI